MVNRVEREVKVQAALEEWTKTPGLSLREAARHHDVAESTLRGRLNGGTTARESHQWQQRVSPTQEEELARWYRDMERSGNTPNYTQIRQAAEEMLQSDGDYKPLGKHWHQGFLQRNPDIAKLDAKRLDPLEGISGVSEAMEDDDDSNQYNPMPRPVTPVQATSDEPLIVTPKSFQDSRKLIARLFATEPGEARRPIIDKLMKVFERRDRMKAEIARLERDIARMRHEINELKKEEQEEENKGKKRKRSKAPALPVRHEIVSDGDFLERMGRDLRADTSGGASRRRSTRKMTKSFSK